MTQLRKEKKKITRKIKINEDEDDDLRRKYDRKTPTMTLARD